MKKNLLTSIAMLVIGAILCFGIAFAEETTPPVEETTPPIGFQAPDFEAQLLETRETVKFKELTEGKVTILLFWTNRNIPSFAFLGVFNSLGNKHKDNSEVMVVSHPWLYLNPGQEEMFEGRLGPFDHHVLYVFKEQTGEMMKVMREGYDIEYVPHVIIIDKKRVVRYNDHTPIGEEDISTMIEDLLRE